MKLDKIIKLTIAVVFLYFITVMAFTSKADIALSSYTVAPTNRLIRAGPAVVSTVTILTTNALGTYVAFMDGATNDSPIYVVPAYTNRVVYMTNLVNNYVTTTGVTNYFTNRVQISANVAVAQTTNQLPAVAVYFIPGVNTPYTFTMDAIFARGILVSNSTSGASIIVNYRRP